MERIKPLFLDKELLINRLTASAAGKASWVDGKPVPGRDDFIECLRILGESDKRSCCDSDAWNCC